MTKTVIFFASAFVGALAFVVAIISGMATIVEVASKHLDHASQWGDATHSAMITGVVCVVICSFTGKG